MTNGWEKYKSFRDLLRRVVKSRDCALIYYPCGRKCLDSFSMCMHAVLDETYKISKGPCVWFPGPYDQWTKGASASLTCAQQLHQSVIRLPRRLAVSLRTLAAISVSKRQLALRYITVVNKLTGASSMVKGPCIWFPGPYVLRLANHVLADLFQDDVYPLASEDSASAVKEAIVLQDDEYVPWSSENILGREGEKVLLRVSWDRITGLP